MTKLTLYRHPLVYLRFVNAKSNKEGKKKVVIYGGNGFVGTHTAKSLYENGANVVCVSRSGHKPVHLKDEDWSNHVRWCKGDAAEADTAILRQFDAMVCLVGSPPLPTFSKVAWDHQYFMNGTTCVNAIESANQAKIKQLVLVSARFPLPLRTRKFAYYKGKQDALAAAERFVEISEEHTAVVLKPGMITGKRTLESGRVVPLDTMTSPIASLMPWQFVSVQRVAERISDAIVNASQYEKRFTVFENREI